jgi:uncharacterized protein YjbI with pentapeptide repeats
MSPRFKVVGALSLAVLATGLVAVVFRKPKQGQVDQVTDGTPSAGISAPSASTSATVSAPSASTGEASDVETKRLTLELANQRAPIEARAAAAIRLAQLAGPGQAELSGAKLDGANLEGANFYGANLDNASLRGAKLGAATLFSATLKGADLSDANLVRADLRGANCTGTNFKRSNLGSAVLYGADLSEALFEGAKLDKARLKGANLTTAKLSGADLRGAFYTGDKFGYPTRFPAAFRPELHGMIDCMPSEECETPLEKDTAPRAGKPPPP